jgi:hypothetical protein
MESNIIAFASIPSADRGKFLPKGIAGIYSVKYAESVPEFYFIEICTSPCQSDEERDFVSIKRIGPTVDLRYFLFEEPDIFEKFLNIDGYPKLVDDCHTRRSEEDIKKNMGYEVGLDWVSGSSILNGNFLGIIGTDKIICRKKSFRFLRRKSKLLYFFSKDFGANGITRLIFSYHNIEVQTNCA